MSEITLTAPRRASKRSTRRGDEQNDPTHRMARRNMIRRTFSERSGSSPTASAVTRRARSPASRLADFMGCSIAALPAPLGRTMMFNHLIER